jgi:UDP-N-acetylmuramate: L-alanyl-gamma-D-glutamyl-meso-diaminopimelate ligase
MKLGIHQQTLSASVDSSDQVYWYQNASIDWDINALAEACSVPAKATADVEQLLELVSQTAAPGTHIVIMSNGGFEGFHRRLTECLGR